MTPIPFGERTHPVWDALRVQTLQGIPTFDQLSGASNLNGLGNSIILFHSNGAELELFDPVQAGLVAALAAAASSDLVLCPFAITIACTTGVTIPAGVILLYANLSFSGFSGVAVTMSSGSSLQNCQIVYNGTGYAAATGILASGITCSMFLVNVFVSSATTNIGFDLSGVSATAPVHLAEVYGEALNGTTGIGIRAGDFVEAKVVYSFANSAGIQFTATSAANALEFLAARGYGTTGGSYGMEIAVNKYGRIINSFAVGVAAGLLIGTGATALVYGLQWSSLTNNGTLTLLPGSGASGLDSIYLRLDASNDPVTSQLTIEADDPLVLGVPTEQMIVRNPSAAANNWKQSNIGFAIHDGSAVNVIGWVGVTGGSYTYAPYANATYLESFGSGGIVILSDDPTNGTIKFFSGGYTDNSFLRLLIDVAGNITQYFGTFKIKPSGAAGIGLDPNSATGNFLQSLSPPNLTGNRRATLQDKDGTIAYLDDIPTASISTVSVYNETQIADGTSTIYYLANYANPGTIRVYIDGIRQPATDDITATDVVTFSVAPDAGAVLLFDYEMDLP